MPRADASRTIVTNHPSELDASLKDLLMLSLVPGVGPRTMKAVLEHFGSASAALDATRESLKTVEGVGPGLAERIGKARAEVDVEIELEICRAKGVRLLFAGGDEYPRLLEEIHDPPKILYARGALTPADGIAVALVGSRRSTPYGVRVAERLGASLARVGVTVVSGLARGIDAAAHRGALKAGGRTIAVLANGLSQVYPPEHAELADEITDKGALLSEMSVRQDPRAGLFPQRNRIISGLSLGVVVIEAAPRSGSLSTAKHANEQGRSVFAVPGPIESLSSRGCHALIRDGARLVETVDDIMDELGPLSNVVRLGPDEPAVHHPIELTLNEVERLVLGSLDHGAVTADELISRTRLSASQVTATLFKLEMSRLVKRLPGQQFARA